MDSWKKFTGFIFQDVKNDNEAKRTPVLVRVLSLFFGSYFIIGFILSVVNGHYSPAPFLFLAIAGYVLAFILTYHGHTRSARNILIYYTFAWILILIYQMGWNCGFQNFCFVILVLIFMTGYAPIAAKVNGAALICAIRLAVYFYTQNHPAVHYIPPWEMQENQVLNTIFVFAELIFLVTLFSMDSLRSEKKLIAYNDKVKEMAAVDPLTGLMNRRGMEVYIERQIKNSSENQGFLNFAIGDIDFFKKVNDTYGHAAGDDLLKQLADIFQEYMHGKGKVARWGGEEFLFLFLGVNGDQTNLDLDTLRRKIEATEFVSGEQRIHATMTFGMEEWSNGESYERTISAADEKLYQGKEQGRNRVVF